MDQSLIRSMVKWLLVSLSILLAWVSICLVVFGQTLDLPKSVDAKSGVPVVVESTQDVQWKALDPELEIKESSSRWAVVYSSSKGEWLLLAAVIKGEALASVGYVRVKVAGASPPSPDTFEVKLKKAFEADNGTQKDRENFVKFYKFAAERVGDYDLQLVKTAGHIKLALAGMAKDTFWPSEDMMPRTRALVFDKLSEKLDMRAGSELTPAIIADWSRELFGIAEYFERMKP